MSPAGRATIWLVSVCVHTTAFLAAGSAGAPSGVDPPVATELSIDVAAAPEPENDEDPAVAAAAPAAPVVPPSHATPPAAPRPPPVTAVGAASAGETAEDQAAPSDVPVATTAPLATAPARFTLRLESGSTIGAPAPGPSFAPGGDAAPLSEDRVSSPARLASTMSPQYPSGARASEIEADVVLSLVVTSAGDVADAHVLRAAGFGFDESALHAARLARFAPATRDGRRVAVRMRWTVSFRLR